jgi:hypothetical protein
MTTYGDLQRDAERSRIDWGGQNAKVCALDVRD